MWRNKLCTNKHLGHVQQQMVIKLNQNKRGTSKKQFAQHGILAGNQFQPVCVFVSELATTAVAMVVAMGNLCFKLSFDDDQPKATNPDLTIAL